MFGEVKGSEELDRKGKEPVTGKKQNAKSEKLKRLASLLDRKLIELI